jgi:hypothetical protein
MARRRFGSLFRHPDHAQGLAKALGRRVGGRLVLGYQLSENSGYVPKATARIPDTAAFPFLPERPTRSQGGTGGSNPLSSAILLDILQFYQCDR